MPKLEGIIHAMNKLNLSEIDGEKIVGRIEYRDDRGGENRYSYYYKNCLVFTFGMTRGHKKKDSDYKYVPGQMGLTNKQFNELYTCTMSKKQYNETVKISGKIKDESAYNTKNTKNHTKTFKKRKKS